MVKGLSNFLTLMNANLSPSYSSLFRTSRYVFSPTFLGVRVLLPLALYTSLYSLTAHVTSPERSGLSNSSHAGSSTPKSTRIVPVPFTRMSHLSRDAVSSPANEPLLVLSVARAGVIT